MAGNEVVIYFDREEDALLFTLAASSVMSETTIHSHRAVAKVVEEISKASRITVEAVQYIT